MKKLLKGGVIVGASGCRKADLLIDGGYGETIPSTVVDCTGDTPEIIRQGKGILSE